MDINKENDNIKEQHGQQEESKDENRDENK